MTAYNKDKIKITQKLTLFEPVANFEASFNNRENAPV